MSPDQARFLADVFAAQMENEGKVTTKVLKAVPNDKRDYRPDPKSRTAWELAKHVATADLWFIDSICNGSFQWDPDAEQNATAGVNTVEDLVEMFKREYPKRIERLRTTPGEQLAKDVDFFGMTKQPAASFLILANNHGVHHRGQLSSYLRAMGSKVPDMGGGSADEPMQGQ